MRSLPLAVVGLLAVTLAAYWPVTSAEFVNFDDNQYVYENPRVQAGLTATGVGWAFTTGHASNWHPLTWLTHMVDWELYGADARGHHVGNLLLHLANTVLLWLVLRRMTRAPWPSALVAALFAVHPAHVESVAWVAERKDVLSTLFWLLTMLAYARWVERRTRTGYALVLVAFALGLMAKPMLVTLPFVLVLCDFWPLRRLEPGPGWPRALGALLLEKLPLFALAIASSVVTFLVQRAGGAVQSIEQIGLAERVANALVAYVRYIGALVWPVDFAVYYPYATTLPAWQVVGAAALLAAASVVALRGVRLRGYLPVGWLWFLGTLVPVIGIVQVGGQAMADRYTYVPHIGLGIIIAWSLSDLLAGRPAWRRPVAAAAVVAVAALAVATQRQSARWQSSFSLYEHALAVTTGNNLVHNNLGDAYADAGDIERAIGHFRAALEINPNHVNALVNLGSRLLERGDRPEAVRHLRHALELVPDHAKANNNLGMLLGQAGDADGALDHLRRAVASDPDYPTAHNNLGIVLAQRGDLAGAVSHFATAVELRPDYVKALENLGAAHADLGHAAEAERVFRRLLEVDPGSERARRFLQRAR